MGSSLAQPRSKPRKLHARELGRLPLRPALRHLGRRTSPAACRDGTCRYKPTHPPASPSPGCARRCRWSVGGEAGGPEGGERIDWVPRVESRGEVNRLGIACWTGWRDVAASNKVRLMWMGTCLIWKPAQVRGGLGVVRLDDSTAPNRSPPAARCPPLPVTAAPSPVHSPIGAQRRWKCSWPLRDQGRDDGLVSSQASQYPFGRM